MRFSRWDAQGNVYLLTEQAELTAEAARAAVDDSDGILQVPYAALPAIATRDGPA